LGIFPDDYNILFSLPYNSNFYYIETDYVPVVLRNFIEWDLYTEHETERLYKFAVLNLSCGSVFLEGTTSEEIGVSNNNIFYRDGKYYIFRNNTYDEYGYIITLDGNTGEFTDYVTFPEEHWSNSFDAYANVLEMLIDKSFNNIEWNKDKTMVTRIRHDLKIRDYTR
jgi:hypothetical protein